MLADALEATSVAGRELALRRLGDISLFMASLFARGFSRRLADVDYHIVMGGRAYGASRGPTSADEGWNRHACLRNWQPSSSRWWTRWARSATRRMSSVSATFSGSTRSG